MIQIFFVHLLWELNKEGSAPGELADAVGAGVNEQQLSGTAASTRSSLPAACHWPALQAVTTPTSSEVARGPMEPALSPHALPSVPWQRCCH